MVIIFLFWKLLVGRQWEELNWSWTHVISTLTRQLKWSTLLFHHINRNTIAVVMNWNAKIPNPHQKNMVQIIYYIIIYIVMCNHVVFVNTSPLYPCKVPWVRIVLQKPIVMFIYHDKKIQPMYVCYCDNITIFVNLGLFRHFETVTYIRTWIKSHKYWRML